MNANYLRAHRVGVGGCCCCGGGGGGGVGGIRSGGGVGVGGPLSVTCGTENKSPDIGS